MEATFAEQPLRAGGASPYRKWCVEATFAEQPLRAGGASPTVPYLGGEL